MAQECGADGSLPEKLQESFRSRHQKEADRLRSEIEELVQQARVMLHGQDPRSRLPPKPLEGKRAVRENQLEACLEKANWYRQEIKRLRKDVESWDRVCGGGRSTEQQAQDRDPMETYNLLVERRKELQRLQHNGQGLDRVAAAQRRAEVEQNAMSPDVEDRLRRAKDEVELQKRLNIRLQAERQKVVASKKQEEQELRAANVELRRKAAQLQRPPRPTNPAAHSGKESQKMEQLRRDVDILSEAVRQDERKHKVFTRDDEQNLEHTRRAVAKLRSDVAGHEVQTSQLRIALRSEGSHEILAPCAEGPPVDEGAELNLAAHRSVLLPLESPTAAEIAARVAVGRSGAAEAVAQEDSCSRANGLRSPQAVPEVELSAHLAPNLSLSADLAPASPELDAAVEEAQQEMVDTVLAESEEE